jgi:hypothetical protein
VVTRGPMTSDRACDRQRRRRSRRRGPGLAPSLTVALTLALGGCSFQFIHPAPPHVEWPDPVVAESSQVRCTELVGLPIMDTVISGSLGTIAYIERNAGSRTITVGLSLATLPFLVSAIYGYVQTSRCHRYKSIFK